MVTKIKIDNFKKELLGEKLPVLLACLHHSEQYEEQLTVLDAVAENFAGVLKVCLCNQDQDNIVAMCREYGIHGTPTFLLLYQGAERDRLLGHVDIGQLSLFVRQMLSRKEHTMEPHNA